MKRIEVQLKDGDFCIDPTVISWDRFKRNPVLLRNHVLTDVPLGMATEIDTDKPSLIPQLLCKPSTAEQVMRFLEKGWLGLYPGGYAIRDEQGNITEFHLYEISICPNHTDHTDHCKFVDSLSKDIEDALMQQIQV